MADLTAQMVFTADASGVEAGVGRAKKSLADLGAVTVTEGKKAAEGMKPLGDESQKSSAKVEAATKNMIGSIQRTTAALDAGGRSGSKYFEALAAQRGISVDALKPYLAQLDAVNAKQKMAEQALNATTPAMNNLGMSAKATAASLRGVPAQFTDIVTSLQGGQAPLTVFLQQGGQLKDMFGGLAPAARAIGGYIAGLITPFTLGAAAVGALAVAMYQGSQESQAYAKALLLTGNYLGKTTDQLKEQAAQIARTTGTQGEAAEALARIAEGGKIASTAMSDVGAAVVTMNRVLGTSVDAATAVFEKLAEEPAKASAKLNEQMHYLNQTTYDRIRALEEQGKKEEAAALAQSTYATSTTTRLKTVESQVGILAGTWRLMAHDAKEAWDMMQGLGRQQTTGELLAVAQQRLADRQARGPLNSLTGAAYNKGLAKDQAEVESLARRSLRESDNAFAEGERTRAESAKISASDRLKTLSDEVRSNADKRKKALADLDRDYKTLGKAASGPEYDKQVANINDKFKDPKEAGAGRAFQDDAATKLLATIGQQTASLREQLLTSDKLTEGEKARAKFVQEIADLKDKRVLTAEQKSLLANKEQILAARDVQIALEGQLKTKTDAEAADKKAIENAKQFRQQMEAITASMESSQTSRNEQAERSLGAFGLGDRAREMVDAQKSVRAEFKRYSDTATRDAGKLGALDSDDYKKKVAEIKASLDDALAAQTAYFDALKSKQSDWKNGATTALANYVDTLDNVAASTERALSSGFKGAEDALVEFVTTGKISFTGLANSIIADMARIAIQQTITKPLASGLLGVLNGGSSGGGALSGDADYLKLIGLSGTSGLGITGGSSGGLLETIGKWIGGLSGKATGGPVNGGTPYLIGEKGPEVFVPGASGSIVPNNALGGGGAPVSITIHNTVGDVATLSMLKQSQAGTERRIVAALSRSRSYGGAAA